MAVPFKFAWDGNHVGAGAVGGVTHYVYFLVDLFHRRIGGESSLSVEA